MTEFVQEACEAVSALGAHYVRPQGLIAQPSLQDLKEYYARPRIIRTGTLPSSRTSSFTGNVTFGTILDTWFPTGRLRGVFGIRFKMVFTIQVAATPFHSGIVMIAWQYRPRGQAAPSFRRGGTPSTCTNIPHVRLDVSTSTMAQLHVPFLSPNDFYELNSASPYPYGEVTISNFAEFPTLTSTAAPSYKLYVHLEDVELFGALPESVATISLQAGRSLPKTGGVESELDFEARPLSSAAYGASRVANWVARGVPAVSAYAQPASWFLGKLGGVLRYFGFSKPQIQDPIVRIFKTSTALEHNVDIPSATLMVAPFASNHLPADPAFGATDVDEMALAFVLQQYTQIFYGTIPGTTATGTTVYGCPISPSALWFRTIATATPTGNIFAPELSGANANSFQPSGVLFWSQMFRYWRGGLRFRVTFAKTKMHAGRVVCAFVPTFATARGNQIFVPNSTVSGVTAPGTTGLTAVWDLKDNNVFEFDVPYELARAYVEFTDKIGDFSMQVLDPILAPTTAASYIPFVVEVKALPDYTLSKYRGPQFPVHPTGTARLQSGKVLPPTPDMTQECIGESFASAKQLIMIPHWTSATYSQNTSFAAMPWFYQRTYPSGVPGILGTAFRKQSFSPGGNIAQCYLYCKGSTDWHVYSTGTEGSLLIRGSVAPTSGYVTPSTAPGSTWETNIVNSPAVFAQERSGVAHFRFPLWNQIRRVPTEIFNDQIWDPTTITQNNAPAIFSDVSVSEISLNATPPASSTATINVVIGHAAGDDAALAHYMGPPPLVLPSTNAGNIYDPDSVVMVPFPAPASASPFDAEVPFEPVVTSGYPDFAIES